MRKMLLVMVMGFAALGAAALDSVIVRGNRAEAAVEKEYKYKCVRSGKIHTYSRPGNYKCPEHPEHNLVPVK
jgi:hypothetical protein